MRRSKLEMYVGIVKVLAQRGPLQVKQITCETNINGNALTEYLSFLIKQGLIEKVALDKNNVAYANTDRGTAVTRFFDQTDKTFPVEEETTGLQFQIETET
jgi:predicted transcriptional regulator